MAEKSGFFNALESGGAYDRVYDANDFAEYFALFIGNGVFADPMNQLKVVPKSGLTVTLKKGNAFIDGYWYKLSEDMDFTLSPNGTSYAITDVIAVTLDKTNRVITAKKKERVSSITPVNNGVVNELIVASISLGVGVSSITEGMITDQRPYEDYCGFVTGTVDQIDAGEMFTQLEAQFNEWFSTIQGKLTSDVAGSLQTQIDDLDQKLDDVITEVETKINGNTAVIEWVYEVTGGVYLTTSAVALPDGFTKDNCYIKSAMLKKIEGTGAGVLNEWATGTNTFYTYASLDNVENTVRFGANMQDSPESWRGKYKIRIAFEKIMNVTAG